ncbi:MAG: hypothetical protein JKY43_09040 [Phycisphaerales bacterium]|nr:hypothetical protein [Phycisphaerales bacterium]
MDTSNKSAYSLIRAIHLPFLDRSFRVIVLIALIAAMSMVDLYLTILYITHWGMNEVNPLARAMMEYQSPAILGLWKIATVTLGVGILAMIRRKRSAEFGAWIGFLILGLLMTHWVAYINEHSRITDGPIHIDAMGDPSFIFMESDLLGPSFGIP